MPTEAVAVEVQQKEPAPAPRAVAHWAPYALALLLGLWGLRGVTSTDVVDSDAARHLMNGVLIHDFLRSGRFTSPVEYAGKYYSRLPATSLPYHPPLFPAVESLFFFGFGVSLVSARLAIALATAASALLLYRLIIETHRSAALAFCSILTFYSWRISQSLSSDVMLEFPTLFLTLASLYFLRDLSRGFFPLRRGLAFALLAGAAVWTKQQAVFLGAVPFLYVLVSRRWRLLASKTIWISSVIFGVLVISLMTLSIPAHGTGVDQAASSSTIGEILRNHGIFYPREFARQLGTVPAVLIAGVLAFFLFAPRRQELGWTGNYLYLAWTIAALLVLFLIAPFSARYLFFIYPPLIVLGYAALLQLGRWMFGPSRVRYIAAAICLAALVNLFAGPKTFLRGPSEAARLVLSAGARRVLYCGHSDGSFVFAVRHLDPTLRAAVIRGDKLPRSTFQPEQFEKFARQHGVDYIVLERNRRTAPWYRFRTEPTPSMIFEREIQLENSQPTWRGDLRIYRFTNPSPEPLDPPSLPRPPPAARAWH